MKVLLLSLSAGSGHVRAAKAIETYILSERPDIQITHTDVAVFLSPFARLVHKHFYNCASKYAKRLWGILFDITNQPIISNIISQNDIVRTYWAKKIRAYIHELKPDVIICTHFAVPSFIFDICKEKRIRVYTLVTDYCLHRAYALKGLDGYFVPRTEEKERLVQLGIHPNTIFITGIPIDQKFFEEKNTTSLQKKYTIPKNNKVVTIFAKNYSKRTIRRILKQLSNIGNLSIFVIEQTLLVNTKNDVRFISRTPHIDEYMCISDLIITKSGGLTTTECIVLKKPIIVVEPIPGLEDANAHYITQQNYGTKCTNTKKIGALVNAYLSGKSSFKKNVVSESASKKIIDVIIRTDSTL